LKWVRIIAIAVVLSGVALTGRSAYLHAKAELASVLIHRAWDESVQSGKPQRPWTWADTYPVARLRIPRLDFDEIVLEGASPRTLAFGPARLLGGTRLGEPGNVAIAGHRTSWFRSLEKISAGDEIRVEWFDARRGLRQRTYAVEVVRVVDPQELRLSAITADRLTLITCYPFGASPTSPQRLVVVATPRGPVATGVS
jgi:sortase A